MSDTALDASKQHTNYGWQVTLAGLGINLALGILYTWSVISKGVPEAWGWSATELYLPYAVACLVFCLVMVPAGRMQDALGPRLVATIGGVLVGVGMILASFTQTPLGYVLGFGVFSGAGFGFGYASATPPAVKWFPPAKTGMIAGIVVSGFGLASVYTAPLSTWLISTLGLQQAVGILGVAFLVVVVILAQLLRPPMPGYVPSGTPPKLNDGGPAKKEHFLPREMLATWQFYLLWFLYACGAGAGLMVIGALANIAKLQAGLQLGFLLVAALAIGNGAGRIIAGVASDKIGRKATLLICFVSQAGLIGLISQANTGSPLASVPVMALVSALIGANYGANLAIFPSITKDFYGLKHFGTNYGLVFTAWGVGGFMLAIAAGQIYDHYHSFAFAYYGSIALLIAAAAGTLLIKPPHVEHVG
ncbi:MAG: OFA family MFS transporter [Pirellulaceae bacterium]